MITSSACSLLTRVTKSFAKNVTEIKADKKMSNVNLIERKSSSNRGNENVGNRPSLKAEIGKPDDSSHQLPGYIACGWIERLGESPKYWSLPRNVLLI
jgi:hypothetical protein